MGAGTGLLTERLVAAGHAVVAVDPSAEMLAELSRRLPAVDARVGGSEATMDPPTRTAILDRVRELVATGAQAGRSPTANTRRNGSTVVPSGRRG